MNYWISPDGEILQVEGTHISMVYRNMGLFGLPRDYVDSLRKAGTKNIPETVMLNLIGSGWIRVTFNGTYLVEFDSWSLHHRGHIKTWMAGIKGKMNLVSLDGKYRRTVSSRGQL